MAWFPSPAPPFPPSPSPSTSTSIEAALDDFLENARWVIRASVSLDDAWLEWRWETRAGWEALWEGEMHPRKVSKRIVVAPLGFENPAEEGPVTIRLRPGLAFGTAEHPTTRSCLALLDRLFPPLSHTSRTSDPADPADSAKTSDTSDTSDAADTAGTILDVGTGSGILAIAAALLGAHRVIGLESDPHACADARENVQENGVEGRVEVQQCMADASAIGHMGPFDGILANIEPHGLLPLVPGLARALAPAGWLVLSGIPRGEREAVIAAAAHHGLAPSDTIEEEGWWSAVFRHNSLRTD